MRLALFLKVKEVQAVGHQLGCVPDVRIILLPHSVEEPHFFRALFDAEEFDELQAETIVILTRLVIEQKESVGPKAMRTRKLIYITWMHLDCLACAPAKRLSPGSTDFIKF